jgi:hypothetical protein
MTSEGTMAATNKPDAICAWRHGGQLALVGYSDVDLLSLFRSHLERVQSLNTFLRHINNTILTFEKKSHKNCNHYRKPSLGRE